MIGYRWLFIVLAVVGEPDTDFLRQEDELLKQIDTYRQAMQADPNSARATILFAHTVHTLYKHRYTKFPDKKLMAEAVDAYYSFVNNTQAQGYEELHIVYSNLGVGLNSLDRFDEAIQAQKTALKIRPDFESAEWHRGTTLSQMGDITGARAAFKSAIAIKPTYAEAFASLGSVKTFAAGDQELQMMEAALPHLQGEEQWQQRMVRDLD
jgi:tetratricopeptide (TPR) repeat protein